MNILTFDIEDWYNCDFNNDNLDWSNYEVRIYSNVNRILEELDQRKLKATFFCLGWLAEKHPAVISDIKKYGHQIGCHSYQHQLSNKFSVTEFREDTLKAKRLLEEVTGAEVNSFRAPGFSITEENLGYLEVLIDLGFSFDASIFPAFHDYGGIPNLGKLNPCIIETKNGIIKEFPMTYHRFFFRNIVFSGGGYFRLLPYFLVKNFTEVSTYNMTYFHPRDFDPDQPIINELSCARKFKSYVGLSGSFNKLQKYLEDFEFMSIEQANLLVNWNNAPRILV